MVSAGICFASSEDCIKVAESVLPSAFIFQQDGGVDYSVQNENMT